VTLNKLLWGQSALKYRRKDKFNRMWQMYCNFVAYLFAVFWTDMKLQLLLLLPQIVTDIICMGFEGKIFPTKLWKHQTAMHGLKHRIKYTRQVRLEHLCWWKWKRLLVSQLLISFVCHAVVQSCALWNENCFSVYHGSCDQFVSINDTGLLVLCEYVIVAS